MRAGIRGCCNAGDENAARRVRIAAIAALGSAALATSVWQASAASDEIAHLKQNDQTQKLALEVKSLAEELAKLKESARARSLDDQTATKLADYLRLYGSRKIVVSCVPNDVEAYHYATELANALKGAGWDALGPQTTMIFGNIRAMGINVYDTGSAGPDTAKILVDAFAKFGIPYQSRVPPAECSRRRQGRTVRRRQACSAIRRDHRATPLASLRRRYFRNIPGN